MYLSFKTKTICIIFFLIIRSGSLDGFSENNDEKFLKLFGLKFNELNYSVTSISKSLDERIELFFFVDNTSNFLKRSSDLFLIKEIVHQDTIRYLFEQIYTRSQMDSMCIQSNSYLYNFYINDVSQMIKKIHYFRSKNVTFINKIYSIVYFFSYLQIHQRQFWGGDLNCFARSNDYFFKFLLSARWVYDKTTLNEFYEKLEPFAFTVPSSKSLSHKSSSFIECYFSSLYNLEGSGYFLEPNILLRKELLEKNKVYLTQLMPEIESDLKSKNIIYLYTIPDLRLYRIKFYFEIINNSYQISGFDYLYLNKLYNLNLEYEFEIRKEFLKQIVPVNYYNLINYLKKEFYIYRDLKY